jgi:2,4-dienoyl-CoA reductase-like NADH-dependent reductase (Old Yellow Enzyme family)
MSVLFQPMTIGTLRLRNRFVRSTTQDYLGHPNGVISDRQILGINGGAPTRFPPR